MSTNFSFFVFGNLEFQLEPSSYNLRLIDLFVSCLNLVAKPVRSILKLTGMKSSKIALPQSVQDVSAWAERQFNKAAVFIRTMSVSQQEQSDETDLEAIRAQFVFTF